MINWFYLDSDQLIPKRLTYDIEQDVGITVEESERMVGICLLCTFFQIYFFLFWTSLGAPSQSKKQTL